MAKFTREVQERLVKALRLGNYRNVACRMAGISDRTLRNWMRRADEGDETMQDFAARVREAEAGIESIAVGNILKLGQAGDWRALGWWLERRYPQRWARVERDSELAANDEDEEQLSETEVAQAARGKVLGLFGNVTPNDGAA